MGLITADLPTSAHYYASGSFSHYITPPAIHLVLDEEALKKSFSLYQGSGGVVASLLSTTPSGTNIQVQQTTPKNNLEYVANEICLAFGLTREELATVCKVQSRKTLYNWINGEAKPRKSTMSRVFDLLITARAWRSHGFVANREQLREPVLGDQSVYDLLNQPKIDREQILFAGSRLNLRSPMKNHLSDPFA